MKKYVFPIIASALLLVTACNKKIDAAKVLSVEDIFSRVPASIVPNVSSYQSKITANAIHDLDESVLCMSARINKRSITYFIQPDEVGLQDLSIRSKNASIIDMKTGLLISEAKTGKTTLFYLPGKFPIDSLKLHPEVIVPVLGITSYRSEIEKITSRWTDIVCKCINQDVLADFTLHSVNECDTGGPDSNECILSNEGAILTCQTNCRKGAIACCWFEF